MTERRLNMDPYAALPALFVDGSTMSGIASVGLLRGTGAAKPEDA